MQYNYMRHTNDLHTFKPFPCLAESLKIGEKKQFLLLSSRYFYLQSHSTDNYQRPLGGGVSGPANRKSGCLLSPSWKG